MFSSLGSNASLLWKCFSWRFTLVAIRFLLHCCNKRKCLRFRARIVPYLVLTDLTLSITHTHFSAGCRLFFFFFPLDMSNRPVTSIRQASSRWVAFWSKGAFSFQAKRNLLALFASKSAWILFLILSFPGLNSVLDLLWSWNRCIIILFFFSSSKLLLTR